MSPADEVARGGEAKRLLDSRVFQDAIERIKGEAVNQLGKSPIVGSEATTHQQQLIMLLQVTNKFVKLIQEVVDTGKLASKQINQRGINR